MANGRRALSRSASRGSFGKSFACHSGVMWITEPARNTITAESRIGSHSDSRLIMEAPSILMVTVPGENFTQRRTAKPNEDLRHAPGDARADAPGPPIEPAATPSEGAFLGARSERKLLFVSANPGPPAELRG